MDDGADAAAGKEGEHDELPAEKEAADRHKLDVAAADTAPAGQDKDEVQREADGEKADYIERPIIQIEKHPDKAEDEDEYRRPRRNLAGACVYDAQNYKCGAQKTRREKFGRRPEAPKKCYPKHAVCRLN